jgi:hypothetical protein
MPIWTKIGGVWKQIDRVYTKISGSWREVNPAKVNISGTWRITHELIPPFYYPSGSILPYYGSIGGLPSGWSHYASCPDQYMPIGINSWTLGQTYSSGAVTLTSSTTANHTGTTFQGWYCDYTGYDMYDWANNLTAAGGHNHTVTFDPNVTLPKLSMPFIQATSNRQEHPAYGVVFGFGTNLSSYGLSIMNFGNVNYFLTGRGSGTGVQAVGDQWLSGFSTATSEYAGHHHHSQSTCLTSVEWDNTTHIFLHVEAGGHAHTVTISSPNLPPSTTLGAWWTGGSTVPNVGGYGTMVMYPSATPPARWSICNGTNGTPDMRDRFARIHGNGGYGGGYSGSFYPGWSGTTNAAGSHKHDERFNNWYLWGYTNNYHSNLLGNESHTFSDARWWAPNLWGMNWIMYTG